MSSIAQTMSPVPADDIPATKAADAAAATSPKPTRNPLKLKKAVAALFEAEDREMTDISYLQVSVAKFLSMAVKTRMIPTDDTETYTGKDGTEKTRKVKKETKIIQLTMDYDDFFYSVTDAPEDFRITDADIPSGSIVSRVMTPKQAAKKSRATPTKKSESVPGAPKKTKATSSKTTKTTKVPKAPAMPVLTDDQLSTLLKIRPPLAPRAQVRTMKTHFEKMGIDEKDFKQARDNWVAYRATHEPAAPEALLDDSKLEHIRELNIGPRPQIRNPKLVKALQEWGVAETDYKKATLEYKEWAKKNGIESPTSSRVSSPKASAPAPAIRAPKASDDSDEEEEDDGTPMSTAEEAFGTALEAIGDAEDIGAFE